MHAEHVPQAVVQVFLRPLGDQTGCGQVFVSDDLPVVFQEAELGMGVSVLE